MVFGSSFFPGQDLKNFARIVSHLSSQQSVIFVFRDWKSAFFYIFTSGKFVKKSFKFSASLIICDKTVKNVKKCWISISVLRPGVKSLKYKKIWLGGDPIALTQEYSAINPHFGHFKDRHASMICLNDCDFELNSAVSRNLFQIRYLPAQQIIKTKTFITDEAALK